MKTLSAFLAAGLFALPAFAQQNYTVMPSTVQASTRHTPGVAISPQATVDTLTQYLDRATDGVVRLYTFQDENQNVLPITGTNLFYAFLGAKYNFTGAVTIPGVLVAYAGFTINGQPDQLAAALFPMGNDGSISGAIGAGTFSSADIDTSSTELLFTYIPFQQAVSTTGSFAVAVQTLSLSQEDAPDVMGIFSNQQGDGQGENRAFILVPQQQGMAIFNLSQLPITFENNAAIDLDPIIMPIVETTTTDVDEPAMLNGLSLKGAYPNPASDKSTIRFAIAQPSFVEIGLLDMSGRTIYTVRRDNMEAGEHAIDISVADLPAGSYLYTVRTGFSAIAGKMTVVK